ncbi:MAG: hypothetical protein JSS53_01045 [Proteobacteria bacterium]|nr:hypothetical protein [Pseudomonadota bacterium]
MVKKKTEGLYRAKTAGRNSETQNLSVEEIITQIADTIARSIRDFATFVANYINPPPQKSEFEKFTQDLHGIGKAAHSTVNNASRSFDKGHETGGLFGGIVGVGRSIDNDAFRHAAKAETSVREKLHETRHAYRNTQDSPKTTSTLRTAVSILCLPVTAPISLIGSLANAIGGNNSENKLHLHTSRPAPQSHHSPSLRRR